MNRLSSRSLAIALGLVTFSLSSAVVYRDDRTDAQMLANGQAPMFAGCGQLFVGGGFGTATYIGMGNGSAWLLTAKHVINTGGTGSFTFFGGPTFGVTGAFGLAGVDISVAQITGWNLNVSAPSLNLSPTISANTFTRSAGYGGSGRAGHQMGGSWVFDNQRRGFETKIVGVDPDGQIRDRFDAPGDPQVTNMEGFGAPGDSGSSLIDNSGAVLGVLTGGQFEAYGNFNWYATLTATQSRLIYDHTGINPVPEPASVVVLGLGALALLRRRRAAK